MSDLHGISLALCIHQIFMDEGHKTVAQPQMRLNPIMKEVVKKEVIKWLNARIIFPISDRKWVSQFNVSRRKGDNYGHQ